MIASENRQILTHKERMGGQINWGGLMFFFGICLVVGGSLIALFQAFAFQSLEFLHPGAGLVVFQLGSIPQTFSWAGFVIKLVLMVVLTMDLLLALLFVRTAWQNIRTS